MNDARWSGSAWREKRCALSHSALLLVVFLLGGACGVIETDADAGDGSDAGAELDAGPAGDASAGDDANVGSDAALEPDAGPPPALLRVPDTTVMVWLNHTDVAFATNRYQQVKQEVWFLTAPTGTTAFPYAKGDCSVENGVSNIAAEGALSYRDMGSYVILDDENLMTPLSLPKSGDTYEEVYSGTPGGMGPWELVDQWYDIQTPEVAPVLTLTDAVYTTSQRLTDVSPTEGSSLDLSSDLVFTWPAGDADQVVVTIGRTGGQNVICASDDGGSFTIPAAELAPLVSGGGDLVLTVIRIYSSRLERDGEVVHMISSDKVGHWVTD